jgi:hypothetical protein
MFATIRQNVEAWKAKLMDLVPPKLRRGWHAERTSSELSSAGKERFRESRPFSFAVRPRAGKRQSNGCLTNLLDRHSEAGSPELAPPYCLYSREQ